MCANILNKYSNTLLDLCSLESLQKVAMATPPDIPSLGSPIGLPFNNQPHPVPQPHRPARRIQPPQTPIIPVVEPKQGPMPSPKLSITWQKKTISQTRNNKLIYGYIRQFLQFNKHKLFQNIISDDIIKIIMSFHCIRYGVNSYTFRWGHLSDIIHKIDNPNSIYLAYQKVTVKTMDNKLLMAGHVWGQSGLYNGAKPLNGFQSIPGVPENAEIAMISEGKNSARHTIVMTAENKIYCIGPNNGGAFGNGTRNERDGNYANPNDKVHDGCCYEDFFAVNDGKVVKIASNSVSTFWIMSNGKVYKSGGIDEENEEDGDRWILYPEIIKTLEKHRIIDISTGTSFVLALCDNGRVFGWGNNNRGQLCLNDDIKDDWIKKPTLCQLLLDWNIKQIDCGGTHSLFIDDKNIVRLCGDNTYGQIGNGECDRMHENKLFVRKPYEIGFRIKQGSCGSCFTLLLGMDGRLWFMGRVFDHRFQTIPKLVEVVGIENGTICKIYAWYFQTVVFVQE